MNTGGGLWHPEAQPTAAMRGAIDRHPERLKALLIESRMRKEFLKDAPKNEAKAVKAFIASNAENALKTRPKVRCHRFPLLCALSLPSAMCLT